MPSIFVWKAITPISSSSIRYYSGSNWFLEEHASHSLSYLYCQHQTLSQGMVFDAQCMPQNWVGSEIMEIMEVPYQLIREDADGVLEQLGGWMRYRSKCDIPFELDTLEREFQRIMNPLDKPSARPLDKLSVKPLDKPSAVKPSTTPSVRPSTTPSLTPSVKHFDKHVEEPCMIRISPTFVAPPSHFPRNQHHNHHMNRKPAPLRIAIPSR
jgi:hypothetical protein